MGPEFCLLASAHILLFTGKKTKMRAAILLLVIFALTELVVSERETRWEVEGALEDENNEMALERKEMMPEEEPAEYKTKKKKCNIVSWDCKGCNFKLSSGWCYGPNKKLTTNVFQAPGKFNSAKKCAAAVKREAPSATGGILTRHTKACYGLEAPIVQGRGCNRLYWCFKFKN